MGSHNVHRAGGSNEGRYPGNAAAETGDGEQTKRGRPSHRRSGPPAVDSERPRPESSSDEGGLRLTGKLKRLVQKNPATQEPSGLSDREMDTLLQKIGRPSTELYGLDEQRSMVQQLAHRLPQSQRESIVAHAMRDDFSFPMENTLHIVGPLLGSMTDDEMDALHAKVFSPRVPDRNALAYGFADRRQPTDAKVGASIGVLLSSVDASAPPERRIRQLARWACEDGCNALSTIVVSGPAGHASSDGMYHPRIDHFDRLLTGSEKEAIFKRAVPRLAERPDAAQRMTDVSANLSSGARKLLRAQLDAMRPRDIPPNRGWTGY